MIEKPEQDVIYWCTLPSSASDQADATFPHPVKVVRQSGANTLVVSGLLENGNLDCSPGRSSYVDLINGFASELFVTEQEATEHYIKELEIEISSQDQLLSAKRQWLGYMEEALRRRRAGEGEPSVRIWLDASRLRNQVQLARKSGAPV